MKRQIIRREEALDKAELAFLLKKVRQEKPLFFRSLRTLSILCIIIPIGVGLLLETLRVRPENAELSEGTDTRDMPVAYYGMAMAVLLLLLALGAYYSYTQTLKPLLRDVREQKKTIERSEIVRKQYMPITGAYHFYLNSPVRISIEVTADDFQLYEVGDEINIEYSSHAQVYFGYF